MQPKDFREWLKQVDFLIGGLNEGALQTKIQFPIETEIERCKAVV